jgi:hypothetical protein
MRHVYQHHKVALAAMARRPSQLGLGWRYGKRVGVQANQAAAEARLAQSGRAGAQLGLRAQIAAQGLRALPTRVAQAPRRVARSTARFAAKAVRNPGMVTRTAFRAAPGVVRGAAGAVLGKIAIPLGVAMGAHSIIESRKDWHNFSDDLAMGNFNGKALGNAALGWSTDILLTKGGTKGLVNWGAARLRDSRESIRGCKGRFKECSVAALHHTGKALNATGRYLADVGKKAASATGDCLLEPWKCTKNLAQGASNLASKGWHAVSKWHKGNKEYSQKRKEADDARKARCKAAGTCLAEFHQRNVNRVKAVAGAGAAAARGVGNLAAKGWNAFKNWAT